MKFHATLTLQNKIVPLYNSDYDKLKKLKRDTELVWEVKQQRNPMFHRKCMALFNLGFENQEQINSFDNYRKIMTMKAGFFTTEITDKGVVYFAKSISFANMDNSEFEDLYSKLIHVIAKDLNLNDTEVRQNIESFM